MIARTISVCLAIGLLIAINACRTVEQAQQTKFVVDRAGLLSAEEDSLLNKELSDFSEEFGSQIMILTVSSLEGKTIDEASYTTFNEWRIGRASHDDGILILVAYRDRQVRIEVGFGLELIVKDEIAAQIIREEFAQRFRDEQFFEGLRSGARRIMTLIRENQALVGVRP